MATTTRRIEATGRTWAVVTVVLALLGSGLLVGCAIADEGRVMFLNSGLASGIGALISAGFTSTTRLFKMTDRRVKRVEQSVKGLLMTDLQDRHVTKLQERRTSRS